MKCRTVVARSLDAVCEDHDEPGLEYHVVRDVSVVAGHHHHRLFAWDPFADVLLVLPPVHLPGLQGLQAGWPSAQHQLSADPRGHVAKLISQSQHFQPSTNHPGPDYWYVAYS